MWIEKWDAAKTEPVKTRGAKTKEAETTLVKSKDSKPKQKTKTYLNLPHTKNILERLKIDLKKK